MSDNERKNKKRACCNCKFSYCGEIVYEYFGMCCSKHGGSECTFHCCQHGCDMFEEKEEEDEE